MISQQTRRLIHAALREDAPRGDITSYYFGSQKNATAKIFAKADGVLCGMDCAEYCFRAVSRRTIFQAKKQDGARVKKGELLAVIHGRLNTLLLAERTALNLLQHLSGVATETEKLVHIIRKTKTVLLDTRKTIPGLRALEKYAVTVGGGQNHRLNLSAMVLIKDNHLAGLSKTELTRRIKRFRFWQRRKKIEIEAETLKQVKSFLSLPVDIIMLDNMSLGEIKQAVKLRDRFNPDCRLEVSGNVSAKTILPLAKTGVDYISCGRITHSVPALDISLLIK